MIEAGRSRRRDELDEDALRSDVYLEWLLAGHGALAPQGTLAPPAATQPQVAPQLAETARLLERSLVRFHPSFRFEEALAARLRALAGGSARTDRAPKPVVVAFPTSRPPGAALTDGLLPEGRVRGLLVGGAVASGVSLAGAAYLVWRRSRPGATPVLPWRRLD